MVIFETSWFANVQKYLVFAPVRRDNQFMTEMQPFYQAKVIFNLIKNVKNAAKDYSDYSTIPGFTKPSNILRSFRRGLKQTVKMPSYRGEGV